MKRRKLDNPTARKLKGGAIRQSRRIEMLCWHVDHLKANVRILRELADNIERVLGINEANMSDKVFMAQNEIMRANMHCARVKPEATRERGAAMYEYLPIKNSIIDMNGVREIEAREDLQEPDSFYFAKKSKQLREEFEMRQHNQPPEPVKKKSLFSDDHHKAVNAWKSARGLNKTIGKKT